MKFFDTLRKAEWINVVISLVLIIVGIILIRNPERVFKIVAYISGGTFLILGIIKMIKYLRDKTSSNELIVDIMFGLTFTIIGLIVMFCADAIEAMFRIFIGVWIVFSGVSRFALVGKLKNANIKEWVISLVLAIIMIICGVYMIFTPGTVVAVLGVVTIIFAVTNIVETIVFIKNSKVIVIE